MKMHKGNFWKMKYAFGKLKPKLYVFSSNPLVTLLLACEPDYECLESVRSYIFVLTVNDASSMVHQQILPTDESTFQIVEALQILWIPDIILQEG